MLAVFDDIGNHGVGDGVIAALALGGILPAARLVEADFYVMGSFVIYLGGCDAQGGRQFAGSFGRILGAAADDGVQIAFHLRQHHLGARLQAGFNNSVRLAAQLGDLE